MANGQEYKRTLLNYITRMMRIEEQETPLSPDDRAFLQNLYKGVNMVPRDDDKRVNDALAGIYVPFWLRIRSLYSPGLRLVPLPRDPNDALTPMQVYVVNNMFVQHARSGEAYMPTWGQIAEEAFETGPYSLEEASDFARQMGDNYARMSDRATTSAGMLIAPTASLSGPVARNWAIERGLCNPSGQPFFILVGALEPIAPRPEEVTFALLWYGNAPITLRTEDEQRLRTVVSQLPPFLRSYRGAINEILLDASREDHVFDLGLVEIPLKAMPPALEDFVINMEQTPDTLNATPHPAHVNIPGYRFGPPYFGANVDECNLVAAVLSRLPQGPLAGIRRALVPPPVVAPALLTGSLANLAARSYRSGPLTRTTIPQEAWRQIAGQQWQQTCYPAVVTVDVPRRAALQADWERLVDIALASGVDPGEITRDPETGLISGTDLYRDKGAFCRDIGVALSEEPFALRGYNDS